MPAIRDPIHNWIYCSEGEQAVIDTALFQRLNWVSQLTLVKSLYPGGTHTRFSHSLGAMKVAGDYMKNIFRNLKRKVKTHKKSGSIRKVYPNRKQRQHLTQIARFCGLLHDIGHGPFSHAFDRAIYNQIYGVEDGGHDHHRVNILKHPSIKEALSIGGVRPEELLAVWDPDCSEYQEAPMLLQDWYNIIKAVIGGPLGADRIDFTMRDSYFTGTQHAGTVARDRILYHVGIILRLPIPAPHAVGSEGSGEDSSGSGSSIGGDWDSPVRISLCYSEKVIDDMIQALDGRHWMYNNVYLHKTSGATHILIERMLRAADKVLHLTDRVWDLEKFTYLNENTLMGEIMTYPEPHEPSAHEGSSDMKTAKRYCKAIFDRNYPKMIRERRYHHSEDYVRENPFAQYMDDPEYAVVKTRFIAGIDASKFEKYGIKFEAGSSKDHQTLSCQQVLDRIAYVPPPTTIFPSASLFIE